MKTKKMMIDKVKKYIIRMLNYALSIEFVSKI